jgi:ribosomal protein L11 methyltransferase
MDFAGKRVLDFGSGTGILAILAAKMGAVFVDAVEIDLESFSNLKENAERNYVDINMKLGGIEVLGENHYETILVNITRNTIVEALPALSSRMMPAGSLLCSGFFQEDVDLISESAEKFGLIRTGSSLGANWSAISFCKK